MNDSAPFDFQESAAYAPAMRVVVMLSLSALLALIPSGASGQATGAVAGRVADSTGQPLSEVLVFIDDGMAAVRTDQLGVFALAGITLDRHALNYRKAGYAPRSFALNLSDGSDFRDLGTVVLGPGPEPTATLTGRVTEGQGGMGLTGATIELNGTVIAVSDDSGAFVAASTPVTWGPNAIVVRHRAFSDRSVSDRIWVANVQEAFDLTVALDIVPVALPEVGVDVASRVLSENGFYERRERIRTGEFLTREEILAKQPRRMDDLLRGVGGVSFNRAASSFGLADDGRACEPLFFVDGVRLPSLESLRPEVVEGMEIYEGIAGLPPRFSPIGAVCGVVVIWTRQ